LLFIIMDGSRNGFVRREEMIEFFSYIPIGSKRPVFPVNNSNALDKFRHGKWQQLEFDGLARLCEHFPYVAYPAYHTQEIFRKFVLGKSFWERFDKDRRQILNRKVKRVTKPGSRRNEKIEVTLPVRCTMQELLEFSRRKTTVTNGRRVESQHSTKQSSKLTMERDLEIQRCPLLTLIRNPRCMYHVPRQEMHKLVGKSEQGKRPEFELAPAESTKPRRGEGEQAALTEGLPGQVASPSATGTQDEFELGESGSSSSGDWSEASDESEESEEESDFTEDDELEESP